MRPYLHFGLLALVGTALAGCNLREVSYHEHDGWNNSTDVHVATGGPRREVVYVEPVVPPQPVVVYEEPPQQVLVVRTAPPPLRVEARPAMPGPGNVYLTGHWAVAGNQWVWVNGHWARPPHAHAVWVEPRWEKRGTEFHLSVGHWR